MAWIVQSMSEGPLCITDVGITMTKGQLRDLDMIGRDNAERSNDIKVLILKSFLRTVRKDAAPSTIAAPDPKIMEQLKAASEMASKANEALNAANANNIALQQQLVEQKQKAEEAVDLAKLVLEEVRAFAKTDPLGVRTIKEALENIKLEKVQIVQQISAAEAKVKENVSDRELKAHEQILKAKEKKLDKNFKDLGQTVSKSSESVDALLDTLDKEGIF